MLNNIILEINRMTNVFTTLEWPAIKERRTTNINWPFKMKCNLSIATYVCIMNVFHTSNLVNNNILFQLSAFMTDLIEDHYLFPMFWIEEFADLDLDYKEKIDDMLTKPLWLVDAAQWTLFIWISTFIWTYLFSIFHKFLTWHD